MAAVELRAASSLPLGELAEVFTAGFEGYLVPMQIQEPGLRTMVHALDLDLDASRVAFVDGEPAGLVLLGIRGDEGWIGGMGVRAADRRRGIGVAVMDGVLEEARARGVGLVRLEVIDANEPAVRLYDRLGFRHVRDVAVWTLDADPGDSGAREASLDEAHARTRELRTEREPWQRDDGTVERLREATPPPYGLVDEDGAAVFRVSGPAASLLQLGASTEAAAERLVRAVRAEGTSLHALNYPESHAATRALRALGGRVDFHQHELELRLR